MHADLEAMVLNSLNIVTCQLIWEHRLVDCIFAAHFWKWTTVCLEAPLILLTTDTAKNELEITTPRAGELKTDQTVPSVEEGCTFYRHYCYSAPRYFLGRQLWCVHHLMTGWAGFPHFRLSRERCMEHILGHLPLGFSQGTALFVVFLARMPLRRAPDGDGFR